MKKRGVILSALALVLTLAVVMQGVIPVNAASSEVQIEVKATDMNLAVTVPSKLPIIFNEDGSNTYPQNWTVTNESTIAGVCLREIVFTPANDWDFLYLGEKAKDLPADTKKVRIYVGTEAVKKQALYETGCARATYSASEIQIPAGASKDIKITVERGAFTESIDMHKAFDMEVDFRFI